MKYIIDSMTKYSVGSDPNGKESYKTLIGDGDRKDTL